MRMPPKTTSTRRGKYYLKLAETCNLPAFHEAGVKTADIEETKPSNVSSMPTGLLDTLSLDEIGDLFSYMQGTPKPANLTRKPGAAGTK